MENIKKILNSYLFYCKLNRLYANKGVAMSHIDAVKMMSRRVKRVYGKV